VLLILFLSTFFLFLGFVLLIKGAGLLVDGASSIAGKMKISEIVIGLTIVSFGTSVPELVINIFSSIQDKSGFAFGNIIGSNIINTLLILGVAGVIFPIKTEKNTVWKEIPFSFLAVVVLLILCNDTIIKGDSDVLSRFDGIILLLLFILFITYNFFLPKVEIRDKPDIKSLSSAKSLVFVILGIVGLSFGGNLVVNSSIDIAKEFNLSERMIGLTILAIGTSLPELFTSAVAAYKGKSDIAIGNVVGSNVFNIFLVLGISAFIRSLQFDPVINIDLSILLIASFLLFITMFTGKKRTLDRWEAVIFIVLYFVYFLFLIIRK